MSALLALLLAAAPAPFHELARAVVEAEVAKLSTLPPGWARTEAAAARFLGTPYLHSPLGEGSGIDPDPLVRFDHVDCVTFVETSLALGNTSRLADAEALLDDLRYKPATAPAFGNRLHFFEAQWIPAQLARGYLEEATARVGGAAVQQASISFTEEDWAKRTAFREFDLPWADAPHGTFTLPFIPLEEAKRLAPTFPAGLVLSVVRENQPGNPTIVSHTGFVVVKDGERFLRHAMLANKVVTDEPLLRFLERHGQMMKWKVRGVNLLAVRDASAHAAEFLARRKR